MPAAKGQLEDGIVFYSPVCRAWQLHAEENSQQIEVHMHARTPKIKPCTCTHALFAYRLNIGSPGVSYYLKWLGAPGRIRCARCAPHIVYLARARSRRVLPCSADWFIPNEYILSRHIFYLHQNMVSFRASFSFCQKS